MLPPGSDEPLPFRVTSMLVWPAAMVTVWSGPALAVGGVLAGALTVITTVSAALVAPWLSVTTRLKV